MKPLRAVIAEDETNLRDELREALARAWPELVIAAEAQDGDQAMAELDRHSPDVLFLDVQMPGATGLEVARHANGRCHVVFVTAYDKYAVDAFEQGAVDYVMKPFTQQRLEQTVRRVKREPAKHRPTSRGCYAHSARGSAQRASTCAISPPRTAPRSG